MDHDKFNLRMNIIMTALWIVLCIIIGIAVSGCASPDRPFKKSPVIDRTCYDYECQERRKRNWKKFLGLYMQRPVAFKSMMLEGTYPKCKVAGCSGRIFDGVCDVCSGERK